VRKRRVFDRINRMNRIEEKKNLVLLSILFILLILRSYAVALKTPCARWFHGVGL